MDLAVFEFVLVLIILQASFWGKDFFVVCLYVQRRLGSQKKVGEGDSYLYSFFVTMGSQ